MTNGHYFGVSSSQIIWSVPEQMATFYSVLQAVANFAYL